MLASILPGIREARVPLAAGALWLAFVFVSVGWLVPTLSSTLLTEQAKAIADAAGIAVVLAAIAFLSYLVGVCVLALPPFANGVRGKSSISATTLRGLDQKVQRDVRAAKDRGIPFDRLIAQFDDLRLTEATRYNSDEEREELITELRDEYGRNQTLNEVSETEKWGWLEHPDRLAEIRDKVLEDLDMAELSLQATTKDVYDKYDRGRAEGEFRRAVAPAIGALCIAVGARYAIEYSNWLPLISLLGILPSILLWRSGTSHLVAAKDVMVQAVLGGQATSPTLKLVTDLQPRV